MNENNEMTSTVPMKETWSKPELEMVSVKESTLNGVLINLDGGGFS